MMPEQFLEMRPCDWQAKKRGYFRKEEKEWAHTRLIISALTGEKPSKIIQLSFDKKDTIGTSPEDVARILNKYKSQQIPTNEQ